MGVTTLFPPDDPPRAVDRGVLWRSPGDVYELLPAGDFANGPLPTSADASFTIVGGGLDPLLPVAWLPTGASFELVVLPLLDGDIVGGASSIDDARIVGWSADSERSNAVLWVRKAGRFVPRALPVPDGSPSCRKAVGVSGHRIAGSCNGANGREIGVVWQSSADGVGWFVAALLAPVEGDVGAHVSGLSLDLAVGWSTATEGVVRPVVWRLP